MPPKVSLVVPAYNAERYVAETIESALAQDYEALDVVAVDDGSTDGTAEALAAYADRITVHRQANAGQSAAMAAGWARSDGTIIGYLSADDRLRPSAVRRAVEVLTAAPDVVIAYPDFDIIDSDSTRKFTVRAPDYTRRSLFAEFTCLPGPGAFFRRDAYEAAGPWRTDLRQIPDLDFFLRMGMQGDFRRIPEVLADFRMHEESTTYRPAPPAHAEEPMLVVNHLLARPGLPNDVLGWQRHLRAHAHLLSASIHARSGRARPAMRHLAAAGVAPGGEMARKTVSVVRNYVEWRRGERARRAGGSGRS